MIDFRLPLMAIAVGSACLLVGCKTATTSESSTTSSSQASGTTAAPAAKSGDTSVVGSPAANSKFTQLQMGMGIKQVTDLIGQPTDQGAYITGKAFIPFYFGGDRYRHEMLYKGQGRLIFAGGSVGDLSGGRLTQIIHNVNESGYR